MTDPEIPRRRCYRCWRPEPLCLCARLPRVDTATALHVLQHPRESKHPFNTARLLRLMLPRLQLHTAYGGLTGRLETPLSLPPDAAVLYPTPGAVPLASLPAAVLPTTLLLLDGTWAQSKRLYADNPWLHSLRHVRLHPEQPSNYRIRSEPRPDYVSTLEAVASALRILEPDNAGVLLLQAALDGMVDDQLALLDTVPLRGRSKAPRQHTCRRLPALLEAPGLLVVYGESGLPGGQPGARQLLQWTAARVATGEVFEALLRPHGELPVQGHLQRLGIAAGDLLAGETPAAARQRFLAFAGAAPVLAAWTPSLLQLGAPLGERHWPRLLLKTPVSNLRNARAGLLEQVVQEAGLSAPALGCRGRAGQRLGNALAVARWLRAQRALRLGSATPA